MNINREANERRIASENIEEASCVPHIHPCSCHSEWRRRISDLARAVERGQCRAEGL
jgi:hypothetical protein